MKKLPVKKKNEYEDLYDYLMYNPWTGVFYWKISPKYDINIGDIAGSSDKDGYITLCIKGKRYKAHRIAWLFVYGYMPKIDIDHKDQITHHNWINNLRHTSRSVNNRNSGIRKDNTSGIKGVMWDKQSKQWEALIHIKGKSIYLGRYKEIIDAAKARCKAEQNIEGYDIKNSSACSYAQKVSKISIRKPRLIKQSELIKIRKFFHEKQNKGICPILNIKVPFKNTVVDHAHSANSKNLNKPEESGLIRGIIHKQVNTMEGKITNSFIRCGLHKMDITLPEFLRNLANFIETPPLIHLKYVHPSEAIKKKKLKKTSINMLIKLFKKKYPNRKLPEILIYKKRKNKRGKYAEKEKTLTTGLKNLYKEFKIIPNYLKEKK